MSKTINPEKDPTITPQRTAMRGYSSVLFVLIALLAGCVPNPHRVVDTGDGGFVITRIHTERISLEAYTHQIYLTKLNGDGEPVWDRQTVNEKGDAHTMLAGGDGGVIIAFMDTRGERLDSQDSAPFSPADLYIQRFDETGRPLWGTTDVPLRVAAERRSTPHGSVADGAGGAIVVWGDDTQAFYAQRIDAAGQAL
jgi:hypothetical protein